MLHWFLRLQQSAYLRICHILHRFLSNVFIHRNVLQSISVGQIGIFSNCNGDKNKETYSAAWWIRCCFFVCKSSALEFVIICRNCLFVFPHVAWLLLPFDARNRMYPRKISSVCRWACYYNLKLGTHLHTLRTLDLNQIKNPAQLKFIQHSHT